MRRAAQLPLDNDLIGDFFAGGGGASLGIEMALDRPPNFAINHDHEAIQMHEVNHPLTDHFQEDVFTVHPHTVTQGRTMRMGWFSPDCKHHSKARGQKPVEKRIRGLAWVSLKWAGTTDLKMFFLENVEEFQDWGQLIAKRDPATGRVLKRDGTVAAPGERVPLKEQQLIPDPKRKGSLFRRFVALLKRMGYTVEWKELKACDYGAPTIRKRLFLIARKDGRKIVWPKPTHGPKGSGLKPYRTAAECIDFTIDCPSIFTTGRDLAPKTMRRIAKGIRKYVVDAKKPFIVNLTHGVRNEPTTEPFKTVTGAKRGEKAIVTPKILPFVTEHANGSNQRNMPADDALRTQCAQVKGGHFALVNAHITRFNQNGIGQHMDEQFDTVMAGAHRFGIVHAHLQQMYGTGVGRECNEPSSTATVKEKQALCEAHLHHLDTAFLVKHFGGVVGTDIRNPAPTQLASGAQTQLCTAHITKLKGTSADGQPADDPLHTVAAGGLHHALTSAFMIKYFGTDQDPQMKEPAHTVTTKDRFGLCETHLHTEPLVITPEMDKRARQVAGLLREHGLWDERPYVIVTIKGASWMITDIGMRMLVPRELARAQGFPDWYIIDRTSTGKPLTKTAQVKMIGNSVCPPVAAALVRANCLPSTLHLVKAA